MPSPNSVADRAATVVDPERLTTLLIALVAADSTNPPGGEAAVVSVLADWLGRFGLRAQIAEALPGRPNLTVSIGSGEPVLLFNAHSDTMPVGPGWTRDPFRATVEEGRLYGRGACDTKAGLAAMAEVVVALADAGSRGLLDLRGRLILDVVADEEAGASGTKVAVAAGRTANWAIVSEPTDLAIARASNGQLDVAIEVRGRAAHGSAPDDGRSAFGGAAALVAAFEAEHARLRSAAHPLLGPASYNVGTISGGIQASIVAAECRLEIDRRILPGGTVDEAVADVDRIIGEVRNSHPDLEFVRRATLAIPPVEVASDSPVCLALADSLTGLGAAATIGGLRATSDAAWLAAAGIEAVVFGPGKLKYAHGPDERVDLADVELAARVLAATAVRLLG